MTSKRKNHNIDRRRMRRREKQSESTRDIMAGKAARRGWGKGIVR